MLSEKIKEANFSEKQKQVVLECISYAHTCGVRYGSDTAKENMAFVLKELKFFE